jgi:quinoprotein glucose dehydrogenase
MSRRLVLFALPLLATAQQWTHWGGDAGGSRYSALKQIHRGNVTKLQPAWTYHTGEISDGRTYAVRSAFETTPLYIDGVLYLTTPFNRIVALEPETGREIWSFDPKIDRKQSINLYISRGCSYWTDGKSRRLLYGTQMGKLYAIDAGTGKPDPAFGEGGAIDLRKGVADEFPDRGYGVTSAPAIYKDLVITGAWVSDGEPRGPSGDVRAFDVRTGKLVWAFHTVPRPGEYGYDTWDAGSADKRGGTNVWSTMSVDEKRGIVYLPLTSPSPDYYGGERKGINLFGDSLVALDAATGKRIWHFQTVHHNIWDYDLPAQPSLITVRRAGKPVEAVAQVAKTGFLFLFDRATGEPLFPIEERAVPASPVPGEAAWPTQPHPVKPPPFARQSMQPEELTNVTPESRAFCAEIVKEAELKPLFTPIGLKTTLRQLDGRRNGLPAGAAPARFCDPLPQPGRQQPQFPLLG